MTPMQLVRLIIGKPSDSVLTNVQQALREDATARAEEAQRDYDTARERGNTQAMHYALKRLREARNEMIKVGA